jgi:hypothetical protein
MPWILTKFDFGYQTQVCHFHTYIPRFTTDVQSIRGHGKLHGLLLGWDVPLPAIGQILLLSPYFPQISFYNPVFNTTTTIIAKGFKGNPSSGTGGTVFVKVRSFCLVLSFLSGLISLTDQSVTINGKLWKSNCYLDWDTFRNGSTVELELTDDIKVSCGKEAVALPPSLSTGGY